MVKYLLPSIVLVISILPCLQAQPIPNMDSTLKAIDNNIKDTTQLILNRNVGDYYMNLNPKKALPYLRTMATIAIAIKKPVQQANAYYSTAYCYLQQAMQDTALLYYLKSLRIYDSIKDYHRLTNAYLSIGNVYNQGNNKHMRNLYFNKAIETNKLTNDSAQLCVIYTEQAMVYDQNKQYDSAIILHNKGLAIQQILQDNYMIGSTYSNLGLDYKHKGEYLKALTYFQKSITYFEKEQPVSPFLYATIYNNIGATNTLLKNYVKAENSFAKSIAYCSEGNSRTIVLENYKNLSEMYAAQGNHAMQTKYLIKYYNLNDSLNNSTAQNNLNQLETDYQLEKKNTQIALSEAKMVKQQTQRNLFIIIALTAITVLGILLYGYKKIQKRNHEINLQKNELQNLNQVKDRLFSILGHDLRNPLITLQQYLHLADSSTLTPKQKETYKQQTYQSIAQTNNTLDNLLVWGNMQLTQTTLPLSTVNINLLITELLEETQPQAAYKDIKIITDLQIQHITSNYQTLLIILRNLIINAIKFSYGGNIVIAAHKHNEYDCITVTDYGKGMQAIEVNNLLLNNTISTEGTAGEKGSGLGILLINQLIKQLHATLSIKSELGKGSTFSLQFNHPQ